MHVMLPLIKGHLSNKGKTCMAEGVLLSTQLIWLQGDYYIMNAIEVDPLTKGHICNVDRMMIWQNGIFDHSGGLLYHNSKKCITTNFEHRATDKTHTRCP